VNVYLPIAGTNTYLTEAGAGACALFLHGVPDSAELWRPIMQRMQGQYHCYAPDLPGLGRSTAPDDFPLTLDHMASYIAALVEDAAIATPLNLVVTDFGAPYGLSWAVTHPELVRRIALVGGVNFFSDYRWHGNAQMLRRPVLGDALMALSGNYSVFARSIQSAAPTLSDEHWRATHALSFAKPSVRKMTLRLYRSLNPEDFRGWEDKLVALTRQVPTLVLWGDRDPFIAPSFADRYGAAQVEHFAEYDHWLAIEAPEMVADRLTTFFA
jgi:pimeloyl-ACP methyl ester carboxylesterase